MTEVTSHSRTLTFSKHPEQEEFKDSFLLEGLTPGVYLLECVSPGMDTARALYFVSGVRVMTQAMPQDQMRYVVVDARTGQPLPNAVLKLTYRSGWNQPKRTEEQACNLQGEAEQYGAYKPVYRPQHLPSRPDCPCGSYCLERTVGHRQCGSQQQARQTGTPRCQL